MCGSGSCCEARSASGPVREREAGGGLFRYWLARRGGGACHGGLLVLLRTGSVVRRRRADVHLTAEPRPDGAADRTVLSPPNRARRSLRGPSSARTPDSRSVSNGVSGSSGAFSRLIRGGVCLRLRRREWMIDGAERRWKFHVQIGLLP
ncbi:hypothetical protein Q5P01_006985 [Channa striata]|uniref:Uncharacterized protein n=1 Tax=Channa striata TaxID=64152 RepID=A0AA88NCB8_CHASR|nr:hypothetical protein Q5P01_006985 [Channa striata]